MMRRDRNWACPGERCKETGHGGRQFLDFTHVMPNEVTELCSGDPMRRHSLKGHVRAYIEASEPLHEILTELAPEHFSAEQFD